MLKSIFGLLVCMTCFHEAYSANLVERDGRYEVNWSTGKIRFYGVGKVAADDSNYRSAEQRAWADGLKAAESDLPVVMKGKLGTRDLVSLDKLSKLMAATTSVSTTYFGDERVKVLLEAPIEKVSEQLVGGSPAGSANTSNSSESLVFKLPKGAKPSVVVKIVDEQGHELLPAGQLAASIQKGGPVPRWFRTAAEPSASKPITEVTATSLERGVVKVAAGQWKPTYAAAIINGSAAFVVE
jgi:hypothetical protein